jgi:phosphoglycolate phosphatase-like HAD superfamily hydrolase
LAGSGSGPAGATTGPAFLFDLDGTLEDSVYQHVLAWREALEACGIELSVWRIHRRVGMSGGLVANAILRETGHTVTPEEAARPAQVPRRRLRPPGGPDPPVARRAGTARVPQRDRGAVDHRHQRAAGECPATLEVLGVGPEVPVVTLAVSQSGSAVP